MPFSVLPGRFTPFIAILVVCGLIAESPDISYAGPVRYELIFDISKSMNAKAGRESKLDMAYEVLRQALISFRQKGLEGRIRLIGQDAEDGCAVGAPLPVTSGSAILQKIDQLRSRAGGKTPLSDAMIAAYNDIDGGVGPVKIVLITDGIDTCGGNPIQTAQRIKRDGGDVQIHIIGLALDTQRARYLSAAARAGDGSFKNVNSTAAMHEALNAVLDLTKPHQQTSSDRQQSEGVQSIKVTDRSFSVSAPPGYSHYRVMMNINQLLTLTYPSDKVSVLYGQSLKRHTGSESHYLSLDSGPVDFQLVNSAAVASDVRGIVDEFYDGRIGVDSSEDRPFQISPGLTLPGHIGFTDTTDVYSLIGLNVLGSESSVEVDISDSVSCVVELLDAQLNVIQKSGYGVNRTVFTIRPHESAAYIRIRAVSRDKFGQYQIKWRV